VCVHFIGKAPVFQEGRSNNVMANVVVCKAKKPSAATYLDFSWLGSCHGHGPTGWMDSCAGVVVGGRNDCGASLFEEPTICATYFYFFGEKF
jgi:hypothetical protein